jgi:hypothetical protein
MTTQLSIHEINAESIANEIINNPIKFELLNNLLAKGIVCANVDREYASLDFYEERYVEETRNSYVLTIEPIEGWSDDLEEDEIEFVVRVWDGEYGIKAESLHDALKTVEHYISNVYCEWEQKQDEEEYANDHNE